MHIGRWIVLLSIAVASARIHLPLVRHHILANRLRIVQFLSCERRLEFQCHRLAHRLNVLAGSADIRRNRSALPALRRLHAHRVGVVLDLQCPPAAVRPLLAAVSAHQFFHRRFVWLLFGRDVGHIVELLAGENVNADAEVTAATEEGADGGGGDDDGDGWSLWDVWNPSFARGGRLNVTLMGRWPADAEQLQAIGQQSKYERRRDLGGLVLKGVLTVRVVYNVPVIGCNILWELWEHKALKPHIDQIMIFPRIILIVCKGCLHHLHKLNQPFLFSNQYSKYLLENYNSTN